MNTTLNEILTDKLSLIGYCSGILGHPSNKLEHVMRAIEKAKWVDEALQAFETIDLSKEDEIYRNIHDQLIQLAKFTIHFREDTLSEDTCLNPCYIWYEQVKIGRQADTMLNEFIKAFKDTN
ncbi:MAG: hypothetical protein ACE3L7_33390 [Candidatus Pristimantibacillus sp.]